MCDKHINMEYITKILHIIIYLHIFHLRGIKAVVCRRQMTDIVFMLDSSFSMHPHQFQQQLRFVANVVDHFEISENEVQVGILTFTHMVHANFHLNSFLNKKELKAAILEIPYVGGGTNTGGALHYGRTEMFTKKIGSRELAEKLIVVITDGISENQTKTDTEARLAKLSGIHIIAIGVGNEPKDRELQLIASDDSVFKVDNFDALDTIVESLSQHTCSDEPPPVQNDQANTIDECKKRPVDLFFILDNSNSIWSENFKKVLNFITEVVDHFDPSSTRIGVISYSDDVHLMLPLDNHLNRSEITKKVMSLNQLTGGTDTAKALRYLTSYGFSESRERPEAARVALIFTDGKSKKPGETKIAASDAKKHGIHILSVGIEEQSDFEELKEIASEPKDKFMFHVKNYNALATIKERLVMNTCQVQADWRLQTDKYICSFPESTDVTFIYDSSAVGLYRSKIIRKSISGVVKTVDFNKNNVKMGVLSKTCSKQSNILFSDYKLKSELINSLNAKTSDGLSHLLRKFRIKHQKSHHKTSSHRSIAIIFVDDSLNFIGTASKEAMRTAFKSDVFVMSIGEYISKEEAERLCTSSQCLFHSESYNDLPYTVLDMFKTICS
ncbi:cartilage matrix protein-like [Mytilus trossulus]|uniref:cartilage matrix protein-like n=1 Tax=Mytilus trossulus TaxID=6551 RepID=UPI003007ED5A